MQGKIALIFKTLILGWICIFGTVLHADETSSEFKSSTEKKISAIIRTSIEAYFTRINAIRPELLNVSTEANVSTSQAETGEITLKVEHIDVKVSMTSDLSSDETREMRQSIIKTLTGQGYQTESNISSGSPLPNASLKVVVTPGPSGKNAYNPRDITIVSVLAVLSVGLLGLALYLLSIPLRRSNKEHVSNPFDIPNLSEQDFTLDHNRFALLAGESSHTVRAVFTAIPFDEVMSLLKKIDRKAQNKIIKKLKLKSAVKARLERELTDSRPE